MFRSTMILGAAVLFGCDATDIPRDYRINRCMPSGDYVQYKVVRRLGNGALNATYHIQNVNVQSEGELAFRNVHGHNRSFFKATNFCLKVAMNSGSASEADYEYTWLQAMHAQSPRFFPSVEARFDFTYQGRKCYAIVMEFLKGYKDLESFLNETDATDPQVAHKILSGICQAVAAMHEQKKGTGRRLKPRFPHGDFHYGNIMINGDYDVKIIDPKSKRAPSYFSEILYIAKHAAYLAYGKENKAITVGHMLDEHDGLKNFLVTCYGNSNEETLNAFRDIPITDQTAFAVPSWERAMRRKMAKIFSAQKLSEYVTENADMFEN